MFYFISGSLDRLAVGYAVVNAGGVGFRLTISANTYDALSPAAAHSDNVKLYTHLAVREDDMELFGFASEAELDLFELLITVSGVGPKAALSILSAMTPEQFTLAVCSEDKKAISRANGIGPKTAARIILELRDKMMAVSSLPDTVNSSVITATPAANGTGGKLGEAQEALLVLGYGRSEILSVLGTMDTASMSLEDIIRGALKKLMR